MTFMKTALLITLITCVGLSAQQWEVVGDPGMTDVTQINPIYSPYIRVDNNDVPHVIYQYGGNSTSMKKYDSRSDSWGFVGDSVGIAFGRIWYNHYRFTTDNNIYLFSRCYGCATGDGSLLFYDQNADDWSNPVSGASNECMNDGNTHLNDLNLRSDNVPYVVFQDNDLSSNPDAITCRRLIDSQSVLVGPAGFSEAGGNFPTIHFDSNDVPFVGFDDYSNSGVSVMKFDSVSGQWEYVGAAGFSEYTANCQLQLDNNDVPYVVGSNWSGALWVYKFNGSSWESVPGDGALGISSAMTYNFSGNWRWTYNFEFTPDNEPVLSFLDKNTGVPVVTKFNGSTWEHVGRTELLTYSAKLITMDIDEGGIIYIAFCDSAVDFELTVLKYGPTSSAEAMPMLGPENILTVHPNPFSASVNIHLQDAVKPVIKVYDVTGRQVARFHQNNVQWKAGTGVYFVKAESGGRVYQKKLVCLP